MSHKTANNKHYSIKLRAPTGQTDRHTDRCERHIVAYLEGGINIHGLHAYVWLSLIVNFDDLKSTKQYFWWYKYPSLFLLNKNMNMSSIFTI